MAITTTRRVVPREYGRNNRIISGINSVSNKEAAIFGARSVLGNRGGTETTGSSGTSGGIRQTTSIQFNYDSNTDVGIIPLGFSFKDIGAELYLYEEMVGETNLENYLSSLSSGASVTIYSSTNPSIYKNIELSAGAISETGYVRLPYTLIDENGDLTPGDPYVFEFLQSTISTNGDHNTLSNLQLAGLGVTWGHIDNLPQTIYGDKTFNDDVIADRVNSNTFLADSGTIRFLIGGGDVLELGSVVSAFYTRVAGNDAVLAGEFVTLGQLNAKTHNSLSGLQLAGSGITYGHIDDQPQTIAGEKTFSAIDNSVFNNTQLPVTQFTVDGDIALTLNSDLAGTTWGVFTGTVSGDDAIGVSDFVTLGQLNAKTHNSLGGLQLAGSGVTYGHIDDDYQIISGNKDFTDGISAFNISCAFFDNTGFPSTYFSVDGQNILSLNENGSGFTTTVSGDDATASNHFVTLGQLNAKTHNSLSGLELVGSGVTYGHISNVSQTIYGAKTFDSTITTNSFMLSNLGYSSTNSNPLILMDNSTHIASATTSLFSILAPLTAHQGTEATHILRRDQSEYQTITTSVDINPYLNFISTLSTNASLTFITPYNGASGNIIIINTNTNPINVTFSGTGITFNVIRGDGTDILVMNGSSTYVVSYTFSSATTCYITYGEDYA